MELGDSELNALKTYFQRIGLQLPNENLVVVIKKQESTAEREKQFEEIKKNKEKWQNIYEKYKEKYHHQSDIDFLSPDTENSRARPQQNEREKFTDELGEEHRKKHAGGSFQQPTELEGVPGDDRQRNAQQQTLERVCRSLSEPERGR